jgi:hypothetical protein
MKLTRKDSKQRHSRDRGWMKEADQKSKGLLLNPESTSKFIWLK